MLIVRLWVHSFSFDFFLFFGLFRQLSAVRNFASIVQIHVRKWFVQSWPILTQFFNLPILPWFWPCKHEILNKMQKILCGGTNSGISKQLRNNRRFYQKIFTSTRGGGLVLWDKRLGMRGWIIHKCNFFSNGWMRIFFSLKCSVQKWSNLNKPDLYLL